MRTYPITATCNAVMSHEARRNMLMLTAVLLSVMAQDEAVCNTGATCTAADFTATALHLKDGERARHGQ